MARRAVALLCLVAAGAVMGCRGRAEPDSPSPAQSPPPGESPSPSASPAGPDSPETTPGMSGKELFETHCSVCHSLDLPKSQRLDRANWEWVMSDMVEKYGASWITPEQQGRIIEYLVERYGPARGDGDPG